MYHSNSTSEEIDILMDTLEYLTSKIIHFSEGKELYEFNGKFYELKNDEMIMKSISSELKESPLFEERLIGLTRMNNLVRNGHTFIKRESIRNKEFFEDWKPLLAFNNCVLDLKTMKMGEFSPELPIFNLLDYDYHEMLDCPLWLKTINQIFEQDQERVDLLQEFMGYILASHCKYEKCLMLKGEGATGKSTILGTIRSIVGDQNISEVELGQFDDKFMIIKLKNKLLNVATEINQTKLLDGSNFKKACSGEYITAGEKNQRNHSFRNRAKLLFAMNKYPKFAGMESGLKRRLLFLPCERVFMDSEKDLDLLQKFEFERAGILNWAIIGLKRLEENGKFTEPKISKSMLSDFLEKSCNVTAYCNEGFPESFEFVENPDSKVLKEIVYVDYRNWCYKTGHSPRNNSGFWEQFRRVHPDFKKIPREQLDKVKKIQNKQAIGWIRNINF